MSALVFQLRCGLKICRTPTGVLSTIVNNSSCGSSCQYSTDVPPISRPDLSSLPRGTGGRSSFNGVVCTVFGSSGFIGRYVCNKLGKIGTQLVLPYRGDHYDMIRLKLVGDLGQVLFYPYELRDEESLRMAMRYSNVVVNLIGRDWETMNYKFKDVNVDGARRVARVAREMGVERLIHFSSMNVAEHPESVLLPGGSRFLATKWLGEQVVQEEFPDVTILRPADVWGQEDRFLRYYSHVWRRTIRWMPLWYKGERTIKQPVWVSDVAQAVVNAIRDRDAKGKIYEAVGPRRYQLSELVDWFYRVMRKNKDWGYRRIDARWDPIFQTKVKFTQKYSPAWPIGYLGWDKVERDHVSDVLTGAPTLEDLDINLTPLEERIEWELHPWRAHAYYEEELGEFEAPEPPKVVS